MRNVQRTAALSRRVVCRALTVVGGAAAGTALAWALSSASASADIEVPVGNVPVAIQEITAPEPVDEVIGTLRAPAPREAPLTELREQVREAFHTESLPEVPVCAVCAEPRDYMTGDVSRSDLPAPPALPTSSVPVLVPAASSAVPGAAAPATAKDRAFADGMSRRAGPELSGPSLPDLPGWPGRLPSTPAGIPTAGSQAPTGNGADSQLFAALPWQDSNADLVADGMATATHATTAGRPGAQPGVAPD